MKIKIFHDNQSGQSWAVRLIYRGEGYGVDNQVIHEGDEPLVEFFDTRHEHTDLGQFVSRYCRSTLLERGQGGLNLHVGVPSWVVYDDCMERIRKWLKKTVNLPAPLTEGELADFMRQRIDDEWEPEDIPVRLARFGLMEPDAFVIEMRERMEMAKGGPLKLDILFEEAPDTGAVWGQVCRAENALAEKLQCLPEGTAVILDKDAWFLKRDTVENVRILCHAEYADGVISNVSSRFDFDLMFVEITKEDLENYLSRIVCASEQFTTVMFF